MLGGLVPVRVKYSTSRVLYRSCPFRMSVGYTWGRKPAHDIVLADIVGNTIIATWGNKNKEEKGITLLIYLFIY